MTKKELRKLIKARLHSTAVKEISNQSRNVFEVLKTLPEYKSAASIACYLHMDQHEIETDLIIYDSFKNGKRVFLPRIVDLPSQQHGVLFKSHKKGMKMLEVLSTEAIASLVPRGPYMLREPPLDSTDALSSPSTGGIDLIVVPGLGFTNKCHRIGHGKGFYDTYINQCNKWSEENGKNKPVLVGIGAEEQLVDHIPNESHDHPLDAVIINRTLFRKN